MTGERLPKTRSRMAQRMFDHFEATKGPAYIVDDDGCWIWQRKTNGYGYPYSNVRRGFYERGHGEYSPGLTLHHSCGVPLCVNADHLVPLTRLQHDKLHRELRNNDWRLLDTEARIALSQLVVEELYGIPGHVPQSVYPGRSMPPVNS